MKQVLHIISSPKNEASMSRVLGKKVIQSLKEKHPQANITEYDLSKIHMPHLTESHINAFFTPAEDRTQAENAEISTSDKALSDLMIADILVVEVPMYNWNIPSTLKAYFDQIARAGFTFKYEYKGDSLLPTGLLKNKKAYIVTSSGGIYSEGKLKKYDFTTSYVKFFLELIGIEVINIFRAEGQAIYGRDESLRKGIESIVIE
ncbi:FMN-dependent NADH-azoreductase [Flavobacterium sp. PL002]|uniref:FMN-dependent NADH-azoreductase n=1 Tax=Flavobacterium sp. PL002 TaxID=1897058 RepID=UPI001788899D|nr:NAD(P)H-dependent oxidoreductase [Flavobacterium sp. PL002]MBE0392412.1 FMN-dependent NADH-azoreductase 1 [Flavobacterium sp. PL002]